MARSLSTSREPNRSGPNRRPEEIRKMGQRSLGIKIDVTLPEEVESVVQKVVSELGPIDILVNKPGW